MSEDGTNYKCSTKLNLAIFRYICRIYLYVENYRQTELFSKIRKLLFQFRQITFLYTTSHDSHSYGGNNDGSGRNGRSLEDLRAQSWWRLVIPVGQFRQWPDKSIGLTRVKMTGSAGIIWIKWLFMSGRSCGNNLDEDWQNLWTQSGWRLVDCVDSIWLKLAELVDTIWMTNDRIC